jgi:hypothetical protein
MPDTILMGLVLLIIMTRLNTSHFGTFYLRFIKAESEAYKITMLPVCPPVCVFPVICDQLVDFYEIQ